MKYTILTILMVLFCVAVYADTIIVPFECYPQELQKAFAERGYKIELSGAVRGKDTWGFIENNGMSYKIHSYRSIKPQEFDDIREITTGA